MGLAETAKLAVDLTLGGNFTSGLSSAESHLGRFNQTAGTAGTHTGVLSGAFSKVSSAAGSMGGALSHAGGQLKGLLTGPLGLLGLGGGLLAIGTFFDTSLHKTEDFGLALEKLTGLTGESAQSMGQLILLADKYGISSDRLSQIVGFTEKTLGKLNETQVKGAAAGKSAALVNLEQIKNERIAAGEKTKTIDLLIKEQKARDALAASNTAAAVPQTKLTALDKLYGISLLDSSGKVKNFSDTLATVADYYTGTAAQSTKAALAAQVFGRSYATLLPILQLGAKGIHDQEQAYADLGLQLGTNTQDTLTAFRGAMRQLGEAISIVQLQLGLAFAPLLTTAANSISLFLEHGGAKRLVAFFNDAASAASHAGGIIIGFANKVIGFWNGLPAGFRDLLLKGIVADRTIKFLFGFSPIGAAGGGIADLITGALKGVGSGIATSLISAARPIPVFVTNQGFGGPGGGGPAQTAEDTGVIATVKDLGFKATVVAAAVPLAFAAVSDWLQTHAPGTNQFNHIGLFDVLANPFGKVDAFGHPISDTPAPAGQAIGPGASGFPLGSARDVAAALIAVRAGERDSASATRALTAAFRTPAWLKRWEDSLKPLHDALGRAFERERVAVRNGTATLADLGGIATALLRGRGSAFNLSHTQAELTTMRAAATDPKLIAAIDRDLALIREKLPEKERVSQAYADAKRIAASVESTKQKIADLSRIAADLRDHGDRGAQRKIDTLIGDVRRQKTSVTTVVNVGVSVSGSGAGSTVQKRVVTGTTWAGK